MQIKIRKRTSGLCVALISLVLVTVIINKKRIPSLGISSMENHVINLTYFPKYSPASKVPVPKSDRLLNQIAFTVPRDVKPFESRHDYRLKKILLWDGLNGWMIKRGQDTFIDKKCNVNKCTVSDRRMETETADAIFFHHTPKMLRHRRPLSQVWILFLYETPYHTPPLRAFNNLINWTMTYRRDSYIPQPYEKFVLNKEDLHTEAQRYNYAKGKTKQVAWFVSNCADKNGRLDYARELSKYISVDIYGACGTLTCAKNDSTQCLSMLDKDYKFYLAFENSNCRDYITEKFFVNGLILYSTLVQWLSSRKSTVSLQHGLTTTFWEALLSSFRHDVLPIVMGAAPEDYARVAPHRSYIHVDDYESPEHLARYLLVLDQHDDLYNEYFQWKGTGQFIDTLMWCRICGLLHDATRQPHWYTDLQGWWDGEDDSVCIGKHYWRNSPRNPNALDNF